MNLAEQFRPIFERFQNLNLIVLIEDLKNDHVAVMGWMSSVLDYYGVSSHYLCPVAHAWNRCRYVGFQVMKY
jgi:hypothetical protein